MEVAALGLRIDGADGIERARDALGGFTKASEGAERSAEKLGKGGRKAAEGISEADKAAASASKSLASMYTDAMRTAKGLVGLFALRQLQQFADGWSDMQSVVGASIGDMAGAGDMMGRLVDIANASYSPLSQTVDVYSRNVSVLKDLGKNAAQAADFTESLNHMLVLTATRGERAASVQNALSKAMAVGKLDAMGLETVLANGGEVAQALAKELDTTVNGLRAFASQGKITGRVIAEAVIKPLDDVRDRAAEMPATLGDAFTRINTNLTEFVGKIDKASGASGVLAEAALGFADGIRKAGDYVVSFGQHVVPIYQGLASVLAFVAENADLAVVAMAGFYAPRIISGLWAARSSVVALAVALKTNLVSGIAAVNTALTANALGIFISALSIAAYTVYSAFSDAKKGADALAKSLSDIESPLELVVEKFNKLSRDQQAGKLVEYTQAFEEAAKKADNAFSKLLTEVQGINLIRFGVPRAELDSVVERLKTARTSGEALSPILSSFATKFGIPRSALDDWVTYTKELDDANDTTRSAKNVTDALRQSLATLAIPVNVAPKGIEKWDEYLKKLTDARDVIGMSARQLGVFEAAQAGANSVQQEMAGIVTAQTDAFKKLQTAIEGKDKKAAEAAKNNIRALDVERQKVELLAIKTNALIAATNAFARGEVSGDVASGILQNMLAGFAQAEAAIKVSKEAEAQITNIYANAVPRTTGGGGASKEDELKNVIKQLTLQKGALGMTAEQAARYEIEMAKGSETDRKRALTLYDQIQAWNETEKAMQAAIDSSRQYLAFQQEMDVFQQKMNLESAGVGMGDRQREMAQADLAIRQEYAQKRLDLEMAQQVKETALTQEQYQYRLDLFRQFEEQKLAGLQQSAEARAIAEADWTNGMSRAWDNFATKAQDIAAQTEQIFTGMLNSFSVGFGNAFEKMVFDSENLGDAMRNVAQGMARAVVNALAQMAAQWLVYQAVQLIVGKTTQASGAAAIAANAQATALQAGLAAFASTAAIPVVGPAAAPAAMAAALTIATPLATAVGLTAMAGMAHDGIDSVPQTGTWLLEKGERVTTAKTSARLDSVLERIDARQRGARSSGQPEDSRPSRGMVVNVIENPDRAGQTEVRQNEYGDEEADVFVADIFGGGKRAQSMERAYGLRRVGT